MSKILLAALLLLPKVVLAQGNLTVFDDSLASGWWDGSYNSTRSFANTSPVHSGTRSISVQITNAWGALQIQCLGMTNSPYSGISFWLNGGVSGGQQLQMYADLSTGSATGRYSLNAPLVNTWQQYTVPFSALGVANVTNFTGFVIQDAVGGKEPIFYVDDIQLVSATVPALTHLTINAGQPIRTADARWFGINTPMWDSSLDTAQSLNQLSNIGTCALRFPGGSDSDDYHWVYNRQDYNNWTWATSLANFIHLTTNLSAQVMTTLNYGTGFTNEAAAWVAYVNASTSSSQALGVDPLGTNWNTSGYWATLRASAPLAKDDGKNFLRISRSAPLGFKYWEIGNENYGSWETDSNSVRHDPYTYALRSRDFISLMKAVDPTIKVGVVVTPGEDSYANNFSHPATNPRTGQTHNGWTPVLLTSLKNAGVTPDFVIHHRYAQNPGGESDAGLLASSVGWASDAANLRQQITDYIGTAGTNIELVCTENNSVSSNPGKQSTSLVNGLFMADSLAQLMQTEFNGLFWWDFRNGGTVSTNNNSPSLYGWRNYGTYGVTEGSALYPTYYMAKLLRNFVQPGDTVISAGTDYSSLAAYAVRRLNGSLRVLIINKAPTNTLNAQLALSGYAPASGGAAFAYGIAQDTAAQTGVGSSDVLQTNLSGITSTFNYAFAPYSATVLSLAPAPAQLAAVASPPASGQIVFQLQGQAGVPYVLQRSTNLVNWTPVSTNALVTASAYVTNSLDPAYPQQFWRAAWQP